MSGLGKIVSFGTMRVSRCCMGLCFLVLTLFVVMCRFSVMMGDDARRLRALRRLRCEVQLQNASSWSWS